MAFLPTNIVAGQAGHVAHSNQAYELLNQIQGPAGTFTINVQKPPAPLVGATGDGVTDDNAALQAIFDYVKDNPSEFEIWFPSELANHVQAIYLTSKPLIVWTNTRIRGPGVIKEHSTFDWVNHPYWQLPEYAPIGNPQPGDIALLELWNRTTRRGGTSRLFINDLTLRGLHKSGSLGLFTKYQQPGYTIKLHIENFETGWALWGQQSEHQGTIIETCDVGVYLGANIGGLNSFNAPNVNDARFMSFYALNIERYTEAAVRMVNAGPNWFYNFHTEMNPAQSDPAGCFVIDCRSGSFNVKNGWATHGGNANHVFVIGNTTPVSTDVAANRYSIQDFRVSGTNTGGQRMIDDKIRGFIRLVDLQRYVEDFRTLSQNDTQHKFDAHLEYLGDDGGTVRIGGVLGGTAAAPGHSSSQFTVRPNINQADPTVQFRSSADVLVSGVDKQGNVFLGSFTNATRPSATGLRLGTSIFNTDDEAPNFVGSGNTWRDAMGTVT